MRVLYEYVDLWPKTWIFDQKNSFLKLINTPNNSDLHPITRTSSSWAHNSQFPFTIAQTLCVRILN